MDERARAAGTARAMATDEKKQDVSKVYVLRRCAAIALPLVIAAFVGGANTWGAAVTFEGSSGDLAARATFDIVGSDLIVTLTNTSDVDVLVPADVLTAVFFDIAGDPVLTPETAVVVLGSVVHFGGTDPGGVVGGEWAYRAGLSGAPGDTTRGISSAGFGLFGPGDLFSGSNLSGPTSPDGLDYGITSAGDDVATGNTPVTGATPLIQNAVVFTLGVPDGVMLSDISNVYFQYGTSLAEPSFPHTPEPGTVVLIASAVGALAILRRRKRQ